ncbi:MAG: flippase [Archaeoglobaceae archaeon]|nr:flippase [Archaeoglobaceae archaeon]MDW7989078.1 flippase [Archaeoglobaceae archaeon]
MLARTVIKNFIYNSSSIFIANITGLILVIFLARFLKPELFGIYSLSLATISIFSIFADLGINSAATRYIADAVTKNDRDLAGSYSRFLINFKLTLSAFVSILVFLLSETISTVFEKPLSEVLKILSLFIFFSSTSSLFNSMANAMNDFRLNFLSYTVSGILKLSITFLLVFLGLSLLGAVLALVFSSLITLIFAIHYVFKRYRFLFQGKKNFSRANVLRFIGFTTILSVTWILFANVDMVMIGYFLSSEDVAFYRAGFSIVSAIIGLISIPAVLFPIFVRLEGEDLKKAFKRTFKYSSALCIPSAFGLAIISENLLLFAYGIEYFPGIEAMRILSLLLISPVFGIYGSIFSSKEKPELNFYPLIFSMLLNVLLNYILIPTHGINGAAVATVLSNVVFWVLLGVTCTRKFGIRPEISHIVKPTISATPMLFFGLIIGSAILVIIVSILVYSAILFLIRGITKEDVEFIRAIAKI